MPISAGQTNGRLFGVLVFYNDSRVQIHKTKTSGWQRKPRLLLERLKGGYQHDDTK
jgi:hypothetical protein